MPVSANALNAAALHVGDVMTPNPVTLARDARLSEAWEIMDERHINHVPVMDGEQLVGILSERHVRDAMPSILTLSDKEARRKTLHLTRVEQVMLERPATVRKDATVLEAIRTMRRFRAGSLPVIDAGRVVGIVTSGDLISLLEKILKG